MLIRNSALYLAANAVSALLGFAGMYLFTRMLSPAEFGLYVIGNTIAGIVTALVFNWLRHSTVRFQADGDKADVRLTALTGYGCALAVLPFVFGILVATKRVDSQTAVIALCVAASMALFELGQDLLRARHMATNAMFGVMARAMIGFVVSVAAVWAGTGGYGILLGLSFAYLSASLIFARIIWLGPRAPVSRDTLSRMIAFGAPITVSGFIAAVHSGIDRLTVAALLGPEAAGQYGASADLVRQCLVFPAMSASAAIAPMAIQLLASGGPAGVRPHLERSAELLLAVMLPAAAGLAIASAEISSVVLGASFRDTGVAVMPALALSWVASAIANHYAHLSFSLANRPRFYIIHAIGTLLVSAALIVPMIKMFGVLGSAWTMLLAESASAAFGLYLAHRCFKLPSLAAPLVRVGAAVLAMTLVALTVRHLSGLTGLAGLLAIASSGAATYVAACAALDILGSRQLAVRLLRRLTAPQSG
jgi:O-antigen/teichoic acid export membrane protein